MKKLHGTLATKNHKVVPFLFCFLTALALTIFPVLAQPVVHEKALPTVGTSTILGTVNGIAIEVKVQSPSHQTTPLQVVCVFEYTEGDIFNSPPALPANLNGMVHVDQALKGLITDLRKSGKFAGHALETILIMPPKGSIPAERLLVIGLGDRNRFNPDLMTDVGRVGMREALRLGVSRYSHASDLKDAGIESPTGQVAINVVKGALEAYETEQYLKGKNLTSLKPMTRLTLLSGPAFYDSSGEAIQKLLSSYKQN